MLTDEPGSSVASAAASLERVVELVRQFPRAVWLDLVRRDQAERWQRGCPIVSESYFELLPELLEDREDALVLVCGEVHLRRDLGETVTLADYQRRFPQLAADLALQFELDRVMADGDAGEEAPEPIRFHLAGFEVLREIGRGASGIVYLARQISVDRLVAIKVIDTAAADRQALVRHRQEATVLSRLQHPNVVQIYDVIDGENVMCSVLEYVDGQTLDVLCDGKPLPPEAAARMVQILAEAVHAVHDAGVLHRDLKPSNVLLTPGGEPKITDFGLAKLLATDSRMTTHNCVLGTPSYMPPEATGGDSPPAARERDVYSLGAILYELLTGRPPFLGVTVLETLSLIRDRDAIAPRFLQPRTPRDLETICMKCLEKLPSQRYASAGALASDLRRFLAGAPIRARRPSRGERLALWCRRNPTTAALAAGLLLAVITGFAGVVWQWRQAVGARQSERVARNEADSRALQASEALQRLKLANGFLERGLTYIDEGNWDSADKALSRAIELRPDHVQALVTRAEYLYVRLGLWDLAAEDLTRAYELQRPNAPQRWLWNALLRVYLGDTAGHRELCRELRRRVGQNGLSHYSWDFARALALAPVDDDAQLLVRISDAVANFPPRASAALYMQGLTRFRAGQHEQALRYCRASLESPREGFCIELNYPLLAMACAALGRRQEAEDYFAQAELAFNGWNQQRTQADARHWVLSLGSSGDWPVSCWEWLEFAIYLRQAREAIAAESEPEDAWSHVLRARAFAGLRRIDRADEEYTLALKLLRDDAQIQLETHRNRAYLAARTRQFDRCASEFALASKIRPQDSKLLSFQALVNMAAGDEPRYRALCAELMRRFGGTSSPAEANDVIFACVLRPNALDDPSLLISVAKHTTSIYISSIRVLGSAYYRAGRFEDALRCFEEGNALTHPRPGHLLFEAMTRFQLGQHSKAQEQLASARAWVEQANHPDLDDLSGTSPEWGGWYEKVEVPILMAEAMSLIAANPQQTDSTP